MTQRRWPFFFLIMLGLGVLAGCSGLKSSSHFPSPSHTRELSQGPRLGGNFRQLLAEDLDGDGVKDLVGADFPRGDLYIWRGSRESRWSEATVLKMGGDIRHLSAWDLDGDGDLDLLTISRGEKEGVTAWLNRGQGRFEQDPRRALRGNYDALAGTDFNGDGRVDVVAVRNIGGQRTRFEIWYGGDDGGWLKGPWFDAEGVYRDLLAADLNEDSRPDIAAAGFGLAGGVKLWFQGENNSWSKPKTLIRGNFSALSLFDVNSDGAPDLIASGFRVGIHILYAKGKGEFLLGHGPTAEGSFWQVAVTDYNGDGLPDLMASSLEGQGVHLWLNMGQQGWRESTSPYPSQGSFYDLLVDDLNGDGNFDLAVAGWGTGVRVFWSVVGEGMARKEGAEHSAAGSSPKGGSPPGIQPAGRPMPLGLAQAHPQEKALLETLSPGVPAPPGNGFSKPGRLRELRRGIAFVERKGATEYVIGPGDILLVTLWRGTRAERSEVPVNDRGRITFTFLDDLPAAGLTLGELDDLITEKLRGFVKNPRVEVFVKDYASKSAAILGEARKTGSFPLRGKTTVMDLVLEAGGQTPKSDLSKVRLIRMGRTVTLNLGRAIFQGDQTQNPVLQDRDAVFIPAVEEPDPEELMKRVFVFGEVKSPGVYSFKKDISAIEAIARAGGLTKYSVHEDTKIIRGDLDHPEVLTSNLRRLLEEGDPRGNLFLRDRDVVFVPRSIMGDVNDWISKVRPVLDFFLFPGIYRDTYALNRNVLRFDVGGPSAREAEKKSGGTFGAATPLFFGLR